MSRFEQVLRDFMKKGENKKCFVCEQNVSFRYVVEYSNGCISPITNSREFDHYVKHATLATWTKEEVDKVLKGGNKVGLGRAGEL